MNLFIETGTASLSKYGEELCGDNIEVLRNNNSVLCVLADGLGSGVKANILSKMTVKIIGTMVKKGASLEEVIETISNTLPICQKRGIAYSTFTIVHVRENGETYVVEFDNPPFFFIREGKLITPDYKETEIYGKKIRESRFQVKTGDILTVVSDGVVHAGIGGVLNLGWQWRDVGDYLLRLSGQINDAKEISWWLMTACEQLYTGKPGDDASILALRIREPRSMTVAAGPPCNKEDDPYMIELLLNEAGTKVVCGGTTGSLVAGSLGTEIKVDLSSMEPDIPPIGHIEGIDLVTEGIITLSKTLERLKKSAVQNEAGQKRNAVILLTKLLLESDRIRFLVGTALNPAHQNPELSGLSLKMTVINEMAQVLRELGKEVEVQHF
ncbi:MAG: SpoIIE family protein phosphatase [Firmicutes bacterium]|nr:SpoIIE family protein phosphatase [Bacillota bacterium]